MRLVWQPSALRDRERIYYFIEADAPEAALRLDAAFELTAAGLLDFPRQGREGRVRGTRELVVHPSYILVYRVRGEVVEILAVLHTAQRWP